MGVRILKKLCRIREIRPAERRNNGGFSLIELSIVLIVMGLLLIPFIKAYDVYQTQKRLDDTKIALSFVNTAIANFYAENGYYPCPADRTLGYDDAGHGREECGRRIIPPSTVPTPAAGLQTMTSDTCEGSDSRGYCRATNAAGRVVYIGAVPYVTLGIPGAQAMDGWKNILTYAVTARMTEESSFDPNQGGVEIINEHWVPGNPVSSVHGIIVSSGQDGVGGFDIYGRGIDCEAGTRQEENCDDDARFMTSLLYEAPGATYYDDLTITNDWSRSGIWAYMDDTNVRNTNPGNIGIGVDDPTVRLDVAGAIRATDHIQSPEFCETDPATGDPINCFDAAKIGGEGMMDCQALGQVADGIAYERMVCRSPYNASGQCPNGQYMYGIAAGGGGVLCRPLPTP